MLENSIKTNKYLRYLILFSFLSLSIFLGVYFYKSYIGSENHISGSIYNYDPKTDRDFILQLFKDNWHWLVSEYSTDFDPKYMLDYKASSKKPSDLGNLTIKTYRVAGKPVAFTAYYLKPFLEGFILFLAVEEKARKHGYARKLLEYDIKELKKEKCSIIRLVTRLTNIPARTLYESCGFKEYGTIRGFIKYQLKL